VWTAAAIRWRYRN